MSETNSGTTEAQVNEAEVDPWIAAFAALEPKSEESAGSDTDTGEPEVGTGNADANQADGQGAAEAERSDGSTDPDLSGGLDTSSESRGTEDGNSFSEYFGSSEESIEEFEQQLTKDIEDRAINDIAQEMLRRPNVRSYNGKLGANINDPDIYKRDEDGVPHFYNPETGREFTSDNPRLQAQQWCDIYNRDLAQIFNQAVETYKQELMKNVQPSIAVRKFAPKYEKLDDIRKGMFDNVIQDYEIRDDKDKIIGYSCDLDKALAMVDRQIAMIQSYAKSHQAQQQAKPTGPVLDMKTSSGAMRDSEDIKLNSIEDALGYLEDKKLNKLKQN